MPDAADRPTARLTGLARYPVKSCRGESLASAAVEPWGLADDRRWMVVDPDGHVVTAREVNALVLVEPSLVDGGLRLTAPGRDPVVVRRPDPAAQRPVSLWRSTLTAADAGDEASAWFCKVTGRPVRLVWFDDPTRRPTSPDFSRPDDRVSFADGYPLHLTTEESLAALDDLALEAAHGFADPLPMTRFRPNVVVSGLPAWSEDDWRLLRIGGEDGVVFRAVKGCARCVLTTVDPDTAERGREPLRSLARGRRFDGATWFGINLVPDLPAGPGSRWPTIRVGDTVEVLDAVAPGDGPMRARTVSSPA
ncbi:MOSC domain-containing protein [Nocardioides marmoraquaticus]